MCLSLLRKEARFFPLLILRKRKKRQDLSFIVNMITCTYLSKLPQLPVNKSAKIAVNHSPAPLLLETLSDIMTAPLENGIYFNSRWLVSQQMSELCHTSRRHSVPWSPPLTMCTMNGVDNSVLQSVEWNALQELASHGLARPDLGFTLPLGFG